MIRIATRGSHLALAQARAVQSMLAQKAGLEAEIKIIKTRGDQIETPLHLSSNEAKGFFTKEIEEALLAGEADIAVHSYKDLPTSETPGLIIAALPERISPLDTILFLKKYQVKDSFPFIGEEGFVATSSLRRVSQLRFRASYLKTCDIRGNVPTRIRKMILGDGQSTIHSVLLSGAGIQRLKATGELIEPELESILQKEQLQMFPVEPQNMVPAPAQGTLAIQCRIDDDATREALQKLHDPELARISGIERSVLAGLEGGCNLPLGVYAERLEDGRVFGAHVYLGEEFETNRRQRSHYAYREDTDPERLGARVLEELLNPPRFYVFGKEEKMQELEDDLPAVLPEAERINLVTTLRIEPLEIAENAWTQVSDQLAQARRVVLCAFSGSAIRILRHQFPDGDSFKARLGITGQHMDVRWATTGESTAGEIQKLDPAEDILISEDGTSAGLELDLQSLNNQDTAFLFLVAENGRKELIQSLRSGPGRIMELPVYRSKAVALDSSLAHEIRESQESCYLLVGSPLALETVHDSGLLVDSHGIRLLCLGRTTAEAARQMGIHPYAVSASPDYLRFISDFF
ncbi:MAG: hydroxymethylbilane synthase [Leptospiraceae bacterium]|nr:hydroxymethylbilane synthase [Leptospiraceae bacterium]